MLDVLVSNLDLCLDHLDTALLFSHLSKFSKDLLLDDSVLSFLDGFIFFLLSCELISFFFSDNTLLLNEFILLSVFLECLNCFLFNASLSDNENFFLEFSLLFLFSLVLSSMLDGYLSSSDLLLLLLLLHLLGYDLAFGSSFGTG